MILNRLATLRQQMRELGADTFLVSHPQNMRYLSGFTGGEGYVLVTAEAQELLTDFRYFEQVRLEAPEFALVEATQRYEQALPDVLGRLGAKKIAFESDHLTYALFTTIEAGLPAGMRLLPVRDAIRQLRSIKEPEELDLLRKAIALSDQAFDVLREIIQPGMTEKEVAWKLEQAMRNAGAETLSFEVIAAGGPAGAMAHAHPTDRPLQACEPIVLDTGCKWKGYCSDITRTLILGEPDARFNEIYAIVLQAQEQCERQIVPGMPGKDAHEIAAGVMRQAGYGHAFGHGLGHGVGLEIHEWPVLSPLSKHILLPQTVFSVEPGIYLPDWGGVRIEDLATLNATGLEVLTKANKYPVVPIR